MGWATEHCSEQLHVLVQLVTTAAAYDNVGVAVCNLHHLAFSSFCVELVELCS